MHHDKKNSPYLSAFLGHCCHIHTTRSYLPLTRALLLLDGYVFCWEGKSRFQKDQRESNSPNPKRSYCLSERERVKSSFDLCLISECSSKYVMKGFVPTAERHGFSPDFLWPGLRPGCRVTKSRRSWSESAKLSVANALPWNSTGVTDNHWFAFLLTAARGLMR